MYNERQTELLFEVYVTDRLKSMNDSLAQAFGGTTATARYADILEKMSGKEKPEVTAEQVISSISDKLERLKNDDSI